MLPNPSDPDQGRLRLCLQLSGLATLYEFGRQCMMTTATAGAGWVAQYFTSGLMPYEDYDPALPSTTPVVNAVWSADHTPPSYCQTCTLAALSPLMPPPPPPPLVPPCSPKPPSGPGDSRRAAAAPTENLRPVTPQTGPAGSRRQGALDPAMVASIMQQSRELDLHHTAPPPSFVWRDHAAHGRSEVLGAQIHGGSGARAPPTIPDYQHSILGSGSGAGGSITAAATAPAATTRSGSISDSMYCELGRQMMSMCSALLGGDAGRLAAMGDHQLGATTVQALSNRAMDSFIENDDGLDGVGNGSDSDDDDDGPGNIDTPAVVVNAAAAGGGVAAAGPSTNIPGASSPLAPLETVEAALSITQIRHTATAAVQAAAEQQVLTDLAAAGPSVSARPMGPGLQPDSNEVQLLQTQSGWSAAVALSQTIVDDKLPTDYLDALKDKAARAPDQTAILQAARLQGPHVTKGRGQLRHQIGRADITQLLKATENLEIWARLNSSVVGQVAWADS